MKAEETYARFAKFYDAYTSNYTEDIPFYLTAVAGIRTPLIDVGCGSGRILTALIRAGHAVTGVDVSEEMLVLARQKLDREASGQNGKLIQHDFARAPLSEKFGAALITFYTFNYIHADGRTGFLRNLGYSLMEGAPILLRLFYPEALAHPELAGKWQVNGRHQMGGETLILHDRRRMLSDDTEERIQRYEFATGASEDIRTERYYVSPEQIARLLSATGFGSARITWDMQFAHLKPLSGEEVATAEYMVVARRLKS